MLCDATKNKWKIVLHEIELKSIVTMPHELAQCNMMGHLEIGAMVNATPVTSHRITNATYCESALSTIEVDWGNAYCKYIQR